MKLHYIEQGEGPTLILLHGNGENSGYFEHQMPAFAKHYRTIAIDTRGHGQSPRGDAPFTLQQFAEDLREFMDSKDIRKAHILGFSDGANIAMLFALKYPERVNKLILNGGNMHPMGVKPLVQLPVILGYWIVSLISILDKKAIAKRELLGLMYNQPKLRIEDLNRIHVPTLVIAGTNDMIRDSHTRKIHRAIPGSRLILLDGDHFVAHEKPEPFNKAVLDFLATK